MSKKNAVQQACIRYRFGPAAWELTWNNWDIWTAPEPFSHGCIAAHSALRQSGDATWKQTNSTSKGSGADRAHVAMTAAAILVLAAARSFGETLPLTAVGRSLFSIDTVRRTHR
jgi:hypothetical protein